MPVWICEACANHFPPTPAPPATCPICSDERQWVPPSGQGWTTSEALLAAGHHCQVRTVEPGLTGVGVDPPVGIGQRALLVQTEEGNLLWDPPGLVDRSAVEAVAALGRLAFVTASHPHFYGATADWHDATGARVVVPEEDAGWLTRSDVPATSWGGAWEILPGVTLVQCGGHFPGSAVVHWAAGAQGAGALLTGDTIMVTPGRDRLTFVWSAPNHLPLAEGAVRRIREAVSPYRFDRVYGGWWDSVIETGAQQLLDASVERYCQLLRGEAAR
ncbi:MAG: hypothetical protein M0Z87_12265 [Actinomycetota bacterium]|nr:hypothetical protein [Actinomycetota bacterium]